MDNASWINRWKQREIGFHQPHAHEQLTQMWSDVNASPGSAIFVPLCGKSRDMTWLAEKGHSVIGAELSELAVEEFFEEQKLRPHISEIPGFKVHESGPYRLYCGDIFDLGREAARGVAACYDRAALIAFPPERQPAYARKLMELLPSAAPILLIALEYPPGEISGPPFSVGERDVRSLFANTYDVEPRRSRDGLATFAADALKKRGVTKLQETAYLLRRAS